MFSENEFKRIKKEFDIKQKQRRQKLMKIWGGLLCLSVVIILILVFVVHIDFDDETIKVILPIYGGSAIAITLAGVIISMLFQSEKPFFKYLYDDVYHKINVSEGLFFSYESYVKVKDKFHKSGGLFTRHASVTVNRHVSGMSHDNHAFDLYDCKMITSSNKSTHVHFDGVYMIVRKQVDSDIQIRSTGSPRLKGVKYEKLPEYHSFKVYKQPDQKVNTLDQTFISFYKNVYQDTNFKHVYISVVDNEIHLGIWFRNHPARKLKSLSHATLNGVAKHFMKEYDLINQIAELDTY